MKTSRHTIRKKARRGFTLIELMITVALSSVILAAGYQMFTGQRKSYALQQDLTEMQQHLRGCEQMMTREIRMAGYKVGPLTMRSDVPGTVFSNGTIETFEEATDQSITFTTDVENDGTVETIRYSLRGPSLVREMWRRDAALGGWRSSGGARSLSDHIERLHLGYWIQADGEGLNNNQDDDGDFQVDEPGELCFRSQPGSGERKFIRMVRLTITAKASSPDLRYSHPLYGDHYRRMTLTSTIRPRNAGL
jgi:prepilin-type N-terminal cleavage/methylation domain-containing protein